MDRSIQFRKEHVILDLEASDRFSAFEEMVSHLVKIGGLGFTLQQQVLSLLREREEKTTFAVGRNIAIPHINGISVKKCTFLYARSVDGIEFGSCDTGLVHHLFLALIPEEMKCGWLKTLAKVAKTLSEVELREELMGSGDKEEVFTLLAQRLALGE